MTPKPITKIHRYPNGLILTCNHPDPSVAAWWKLERSLGHDWDGATTQPLAGALARDMVEALEAGESAVREVSG